MDAPIDSALTHDSPLVFTDAAARKVADLIRAREFSAKPGFGCGFCDYKPLCPAHEQLISIRLAQRPAAAKEHSDS